MSDIDTGAAPAAAEPSSVVNDQVVQTPNPIKTEPQSQPAEKAEPKEQPKPSAREAIANARKKVDDQEKAEATKPVRSDPNASKQDTDKAAPQQPKDENRQPSAERKETATDVQRQQKQISADQTQQQPQKSRYEAPKRFSSDAAATTDWEKTPESVQAAVHRVQREMEDGITKYKSSHDAFEEVRPFAERAKQGGTDLKTALTTYVGMEDALRQNPVAGLNQIMQNLDLRTRDGRQLTLRDVAAHVLGQTPDQVYQQQDQTITELRQELASLRQQISGVSDGFQQQQISATQKEVDAFAAQPEHSRFYDLMDDIAFFLKSDKIDGNLSPIERLKEAYKLADRLNPDTTARSSSAQASDATAASASDAERQALEVQTQRGSKSINGAPSAGSDPARRETSSSVKDSLKRAFAQAG
ncbi:MAG: hypothetical protein PGN22_02645 [Agrobacterium cavarae]